MNQHDVTYRRAKVGYFVQEPMDACRTCGACSRDGKYYYCRRNEMWVNSRGICVKHDPTPYRTNRYEEIPLPLFK